MRSDPTRGALADIKQNIELARAFVAGMSFAEFRADQRTAYAVIRCPEIVSEASRRLPAALKQRHPHIPWSDIAAAGSVYRHAYQVVRDDIVWQTVQHSLEPLLAMADKELADIERP